jgi:hypothetical protein
MSKTVLKTWTFSSDSNPNKKYETIQYLDGSTSCNCKGWCIKRGAERSCKHTRMVDMGRADREAEAVWNNPNAGELQVEQLQTRPPQQTLPEMQPVSLEEDNTAKMARIRKQLDKKKKSEAIPQRVVNWL